LTAIACRSASPRPRRALLLALIDRTPAGARKLWRWHGATSSPSAGPAARTGRHRAASAGNCAGPAHRHRLTRLAYLRAEALDYDLGTAASVAVMEVTEGLPPPTRTCLLAATPRAPPAAGARPAGHAPARWGSSTPRGEPDWSAAPWPPRRSASVAAAGRRGAVSRPACAQVPCVKPSWRCALQRRHRGGADVDLRRPGRLRCCLLRGLADVEGLCQKVARRPGRLRRSATHHW